MTKESCGTGHGVLVWCNQDPCGVVCASVTWGLILYAQYVINKVVIWEWLGLFSIWGLLNFLAFNAVGVLAFSSHVRAMTTNPGAVPRDATPLPEDEALDGAGAGGEEGKSALGAEGGGGSGGAAGGANGRQRTRKYCRRCNAFKPPRAHHCSICRRCIVKMDHHCPWVNNCVGIGNHKLFLLFIFYIFLMCSYALALVVARYAGCLHDDDACGDAAANLLVVFLVIEAILFGLFTCCMMLDQWTVVSTNTTAIDRLKGEYHAIRADVNEVFGGKDGRFRLDWFLPVPARFPQSMASDIMGYRIDDGEEGGEMGGEDNDGGLDAEDLELGRAAAAKMRAQEEEQGILMVDRRRSVDVGSLAGASSGLLKGPLAYGGAMPVGGSSAVNAGGSGARERVLRGNGGGHHHHEDEPVVVGGEERVKLLRPTSV